MAQTPDNPTPPNAIAVIRYALVLGSLAMVAMGILTFLQVMPFPRWTGLLFLLVAVIDLTIGFAVFSKPSQS